MIPEQLQAHFNLYDLIDGEKTTPKVELDSFVHNPNTGEPLQPIRATDRTAVARALSAAARVHASGAWADRSPEARADVLDAAGDLLMGQVPTIAAVESLHTGMVIRTTGFVNAIVWLAFKAAAGVLRSGHTLSTAPGPHGDVEIHRSPLGPAVCIVPWNSPAALAAHKVANALAAGCPVILKPSEYAPYAPLFLAPALEEAGLPPGVFQVVNGGPEVGRQLVNDARVRAVSFTGGLQGGREVAAACAQDFKSLQLELGGNNAMVVLPDADIEKTAAGLVEGLTTLNGQWCRAVGRVLVHADMEDTLLEAAMAAFEAVNLGDSMSEESKMGPLVHKGHFDRVAAAVAALESKGGARRASTPLPDLPGYFTPPTLVTGVDPEETLEEIFGPVAAVHSYRTEAEALQLANQTPYGLGGYVYSADEDRALAFSRKMRTGGVKINGVSLLELNVDAPRPAWGLSGLGAEGTLETFDVFCGQTVVGVADR